MRAFLLAFIVSIFALPAGAQAPFSWTRVAECLPDMRTAPIQLACTSGGAKTTVAKGRYVLLVTVGTAHIKQGSTTCTTDDAAWMEGTQVPVDEGTGGDWCCLSSAAAKVQLVRCK